LIAAILALSFLPGCAYMTAQGRREMATRHYADKQLKGRKKDVAKARKAEIRQLKKDLQPQPMGERKISSTVETVPSTQPNEPVSAPITVSAADPGQVAEPNP
jgi:hypothetical protein